MAGWFCNGEPVSHIPVDDRGLQYADGVFETIAIRGGLPRLWELHAERLESSCQRLDIGLPGRTELRRQLAHALNAAGYEHRDALVKLIVTRGSGPRGYRPPGMQIPTLLFGVFDRTSSGDAGYADGIEIRLCDTRLASQPQTAGIKTLARLDQVMAMAEWDDPDIVEGIMCDQCGNPVCGTMSNLFVVSGHVLTTPAITDCGVSGIMREHIIRIAAANNLRIDVTSIDKATLENASEIFVCNSQFGVLPVRRYGDRMYTDRSATKQVTALLRANGVCEGPE